MHPMKKLASELSGVIADYEHTGTFDNVSLGTVKRVQAALWGRSVNEPESIDLIDAADKHADNYPAGEPIPANEVRAAITNAFYAGSRFTNDKQRSQIAQLSFYIGEVMGVASKAADYIRKEFPR